MYPSSYCWCTNKAHSPTCVILHHIAGAQTKPTHQPVLYFIILLMHKQSPLTNLCYPSSYCWCTNKAHSPTCVGDPSSYCWCTNKAHSPTCVILHHIAGAQTKPTHQPVLSFIILLVHKQSPLTNLCYPSSYCWCTNKAHSPTCVILHHIADAQTKPTHQPVSRTTGKKLHTSEMLFYGQKLSSQNLQNRTPKDRT